jgi:septal ring factor EnvC (AmiA/AmiB activator)
MASPEFEHRVSQLRHDVDDVYELLDRTNKTVATISATQQRHGNRLEEIQSSLDLTVGRLDRLEQNQRDQGDKLDAILAVLRGGHSDA